MQIIGISVLVGIQVDQSALNRNCSLAELLAQKTSLRNERDRFVAFAFAAADLLLEIDEKRSIQFASGAARQFTGRDASALVGQPLLNLVASADRRLVAAALDRVKRGTRFQPVPVRFAEGKQSVWLAGFRLPDSDGLTHLAVSGGKISWPQVPASNRDKATGLLAEAEFRDRATTWLQANGDGGDRAELTLLELSGVPELQSCLDGDAAANLMADIGAVLRAASLEGDAAVRLGPDRFGLLHEPSVEIAGVEQRIATLAGDADPRGRGVTVHRHSLQLSTADLTAADGARALGYVLSKFATAGVDALSTPSLVAGMTELLADTASRITELRQTVANRSFHIVLQPIVKLQNGVLHHYEALLRTAKGESPVAFLGFAESVDLSGEVDLAVCERVIHLLLESAQRNPLPEVAVNLSARSLGSDSFVAALRTMLNRNSSIRNKVMFEITETSQIDDLVRAEAVLQQLRRDGHRICLDDFGTGATSFPYLEALTVDFVKIDGAYVQRMLSVDRDRAIIKATVGLCRDLDIKTVAEMIETAQQAEALRSLGIDYGQGYLFGKPAPPRPA